MTHSPEPEAGAQHPIPTSTEVLVVGAGPAGSSAAAWAAAAGRSVVLADSAVFPRDKTCGDGLTPRAVAELDRLGLGEWVRARAVSRGLRMCGWGRSAELQWPDGTYPTVGSAVPRTDLDDRIRQTAVERGAVMAQGAKAVSAERDGQRVKSVTFKTAQGTHTINCQTLVVADGVRSTLGKQLGRVWHQDTPYAVAARAYIKSGRSDDPFITAHMELKNPEGGFVPGYGWIFPLGNGEVNVGLGSISTAKRPARVALHPLLERYAEEQRAEWDFVGDVRAVRSALLPMAGSVSNIAGPNWACIGDAAACINPLNGEGIDYGLEGGRMLVSMLDEPDLTKAWPDELRAHYGAAFSIGRRVVAFGSKPGVFRVGGPVALRSRRMLHVLLRTMGNLITDEDRDFVARMWRTAGRTSMRIDQRPPFS